MWTLPVTRGRAAPFVTCADGRPSADSVPFGLELKVGVNAVERGMAGVAAELVASLAAGLAGASSAPAAPVFAHPLHAYPRGPMVRVAEIPPALWLAFSELLPRPSQSDAVLAEAECHRRAADDKDPRLTVLKATECISHAKNPSDECWQDVFSKAGVRGPRRGPGSSGTACRRSPSAPGSTTSTR